MSMPSSSDDVATIARSSPRLSWSSITTRCSRASEPWCALTSSSTIRPVSGSTMPGTPSSTASSLSFAARRSAARRALQKMIVDRLARMRLQDLRVDARPDRRAAFGQRRRRRTGLQLGRRPAERRHVLDRDDHFDLELLADAGVDDPHRPLDARLAVAAEELGHLLERALGGRQPDPLRRSLGDLLEPLERERQMGATLGGGHRVDLVDDHRLDADERLTGRRGAHQIQRLGGGDEEIGRAPDQLLTIVGRGVAGAHPDLGCHERSPSRSAASSMPLSGARRFFSMSKAERPQRRDVEHTGAMRPLLRPRRRGEPVDRRQERGERLARTRSARRSACARRRRCAATPAPVVASASGTKPRTIRERPARTPRAPDDQRWDEATEPVSHRFHVSSSHASRSHGRPTCQLTGTGPT